MKKKLLAIACAVSLTLTACTSDQISGGIGAAGSLFKGFTVSEEQLVAESRLSAKEMDKQAKVASSKSKYTRRLNKLTKNLKNHDGLTLNYKVHINENINAYAMPDGTVRINSGLMDKMSDDEVLSVIGHEIGHVVHKHSLNRYKKAYITKAAKEGITAYGGTAGALAGAYGDIGEAFIGAQFSQSNEFESDAYGVALLHKLGRDPYAAASAQEKLGSGSGGMFSSHPASQKRIDRARKAADKVTGK